MRRLFENVKDNQFRINETYVGRQLSFRIRNGELNVEKIIPESDDSFMLVTNDGNFRLDKDDLEYLSNEFGWNSSGDGEINETHHEVCKTCPIKLKDESMKAALMSHFKVSNLFAMSNKSNGSSTIIFCAIDKNGYPRFYDGKSNELKIGESELINSDVISGYINVFGIKPFQTFIRSEIMDTTEAFMYQAPGDFSDKVEKYIKIFGDKFKLVFTKEMISEFIKDLDDSWKGAINHAEKNREFHKMAPGEDAEEWFSRHTGTWGVEEYIEILKSHKLI